MLKRYDLVCPSCNESSILLPANMPEKPFCAECDEDVEIEVVEKFIHSWSEYLKDRAVLINHDASNNGNRYKRNE